MYGSLTFASSNTLKTQFSHNSPTILPWWDGNRWEGGQLKALSKNSLKNIHNLSGGVGGLIHHVSVDYSNDILKL